MRRRTAFVAATLAMTIFVTSIEARHGHITRYGNTYVNTTYVAPPIVGGPWNYGSPWNYGGAGYGGVGYGSPWGYGGVWSPGPVFIPADALYGPGPILRMMGIAASASTVPTTTIVVAPNQPAAPPVAPGGAQAGAGQAPQTQPIVRASNRQSRDRAQQWITIGDNYFGKQRYNEAYQRYKDAGVMASDVADVFFREGFALAAMGRWDLAVQAMRRGLQFDAAWPRSNFQLDALYNGNKLAKTAQAETLARAAAAGPRDPNVLYLIAVQLYFDNQRERSKLFFERARDLDPAHAEHVQPFLEELARPAVAPVGVPRQM